MATKIRTKPITKTRIKTTRTKKGTRTRETTRENKDNKNNDSEVNKDNKKTTRDSTIWQRSSERPLNVVTLTKLTLK